MKKYVKQIMAVALALAFSSGMAAPVPGSETKNTNDLGTTTFYKSELDKVYQNYFLLKDALTNDDAAKAAGSAGELEKAISSVPMNKLGSNEHTVWMKAEKALKDGAGKIAKESNIDLQRAHFAKLSTALFGVMEVVKPANKVYYQTCPMYDNGKGGNWISKNEKVKNPYFGSKMLTCGKTTQTIQ